MNRNHAAAAAIQNRTWRPAERELTHWDQTSVIYLKQKAARVEDEASVEMFSAPFLWDSLLSQEGVPAHTLRPSCSCFLISGARWRSTGAAKMAGCEVTVCLNLFSVWHWGEGAGFPSLAGCYWRMWMISVCVWCLRLLCEALQNHNISSLNPAGFLDSGEKDDGTCHPTSLMAADKNATWCMWTEFIH